MAEATKPKDGSEKGLAASKLGQEDLVKKRLEELDDDSRYFYAGLVACSLVFTTPKRDQNGKYCDLDEDSRWSLDFFIRFTKRIELPPRQKDSMLLVLQGEVPKQIMMYAEDFKHPDKRHLMWIVMHDLVNFSIESGTYDARARVAIREITTALNLDWMQVQVYEDTMAQELRYQVQLTEEEIKHMENRDRQNSWKKYAMVAGATVGGGVLIGLTAGLAAPFIAASAGVLVGGSGAAFLASAGGVALITTLFGGAGAGLAGNAMKNRMGSLKEFEFQLLTDENHMHVLIAVTGWVQDRNEDFRDVWRCLEPVGEQYAVRWESEELGDLGKFLESQLSNKAIGFATTQFLQTTILSTLLAAVAWPATLLAASEVIDNSWARCAARADLAGIVLADTLAARVQGHRPVVLVGYSLGARMIFAALEELARRKVPVKGVVEDVYLFGAAVPNDRRRWERVRSVVSGRLVNCYCQEDWILGFLYRSLHAVSDIAGISKVVGVSYQSCRGEQEGVENIDVTDIVQGHLDYSRKMPYLLHLVGLNSKAPPDFSAPPTPALSPTPSQRAETAPVQPAPSWV